jgi:cytochrome c oxidase subunit 4
VKERPNQPDVDPTGGGVKNEEEGGRVKAQTYVRIWLALILLTGATVSVAGRALGPVSIFAALVIAGLKAGLVLSYFMHLKYEMLFLKLVVPGTVITLVLFIGFVFSDVVFR